MGLKPLIALLVLAAAAFAAWHFRQEPVAQRLLGSVQNAPAPRARLPAPGAARKCRRADGSLLYTQEACPPGSQEQALSGGAVTVLPGQPKPSAPAASLPNARALLGPAEEQSLRDKRMEAVIGK